MKKIAILSSNIILGFYEPNLNLHDTQDAAEHLVAGIEDRFNAL